MNMERQGCIRRRLCFNKTLDVWVLLNCCPLPLKGLTGVCLAEGKQEEIICAKKKKKRFYKWAEYGSGSRLYIHRFRFHSDLCWTGFENLLLLSGLVHTEAQSAHMNLHITETFAMLQHSIFQTPLTRMLNCLQAEENGLRLCWTATKQIIESNVHFDQRFVI